MSKHTGKAWEIGDLRNGDAFTIECDGIIIAQTHDSNDEANARLIAAAPEMYEILQKLGEIVDAEHEGEAMDALLNLMMDHKPKALLAKIEGGSDE